MMNRYPNPDIEMLQFPELSKDCDIFHFVTTRHGGVSKGNYATFNLGEYAGDNPEDVRTNRQILSDAIGVVPERLLVPHQIHGTTIRIIEDSFFRLPVQAQKQYIDGTDALVTTLPNVCVAVTTADCVPILLYAPDVKAVAAVHAGWRGTVQEIARKTVHLLTQQLHANPACLRAGIGPSIGPQAFDVGEEVVEAFRATTDLSLIMHRNPLTGKAHINLWEANRQQLLKAGLSANHIEIAAICTHTHAADFYSARQRGIASGRVLSGIFLK